MPANPRDLTRCRWSELAELRYSPRRYRHLQGTPRQATKDMILGSAVDCLVLTPDEAPARVKCLPKAPKLVSAVAKSDWIADIGATFSGVDYLTTPDVRLAAEPFCAAVLQWLDYQGFVPLTREQYDAAREMADLIRRHPVAQEKLITAPGRSQVELAYEDDGGRYGGRADRVLDTGAIWDLKTTRDISLRGCQRTIVERAYYGQLAYYRWLLASSQCASVSDLPMPGIVWAHNIKPYDVRVQELSPAWMRLGDELVDTLLVRRAQCEARGVWPGVSEDLEVSEPPDWMLAEREGEQ